MWTIFLKTIKEKWKFTLILSAIAVVTVWMYLSLFPTFSKQSVEYEKLLSQFPKEMWEVFGIKNGQFSMSTLEQFLSVEMFSLLWPIMIIIIFINFGVSFIAGEIDKGTIEILLSLPISRIKTFLAKYLAGVLLLASFCFVSIMCIIPLAMIYNIDYQALVYVKAFTSGLLFCLAGFSLTMLFSSVFEKGKASGLTTGLFLVMYIINILSSLKDSLENLQYLSLFHYLDISKILSENKLEIVSVVVFSVVTFISTVAAAICFSKRDISV